MTSHQNGLWGTALLICEHNGSFMEEELRRRFCVICIFLFLFSFYFIIFQLFYFSYLFLSFFNVFTFIYLFIFIFMYLSIFILFIYYLFILFCFCFSDFVPCLDFCLYFHTQARVSLLLHAIICIDRTYIQRHTPLPILHIYVHTYIHIHMCVRLCFFTFDLHEKV